MAKNPDFRDFWLKWPFLAISRQNSPVATGLKVAENPIFGVFLQKRGKIPGFRDPGRGFYINPSRAPPGPGLRDPRALESPSPGAGEPSGTPGLRDPVPGPGPGPLPGSPGGPRRPLRRPGRPLPAPGGGLFYINPSRRGPAVPAGSGSATPRRKVTPGRRGPRA